MQSDEVVRSMCRPERFVPGPVLAPAPYHPVGLSIDVKRESVERDLHFQLHFPHGVISLSLRGQAHPGDAGRDGREPGVVHGAHPKDVRHPVDPT